MEWLKDGGASAGLVPRVFVQDRRLCNYLTTLAPFPILGQTTQLLGLCFLYGIFHLVPDEINLSSHSAALMHKRIYDRRILAGREFRLLTISPSSNPNQRVKCNCRPYQLDEAPPYEALSYFWGTDQPPVEIECNRETITVGFNLAAALMRLRLSAAERIIWADALCIIQDDNEEKSHQVPLMGSIYSLASRVVVWLGHEDLQVTEEAAKCVSYIADACREFERNRGPDAPRLTRHGEVDLPIEEFTSAARNSLQKLYDRPWFTRVWCIQEIRLAQDALILWGQQEMTWANVGLASSWIFAKLDSLNESRDLESSHDIFPVYAVSMYWEIGGEVSLLDAMQAYSKFGATNLRDKVYGLLNLITIKSEVEALNVNYNKTVAEVYADTALSIIRLYSKLSTLAIATHFDEDYLGNDSFRSWAPRWDQPWVAVVMGFPEEKCPWNACGGRPVKRVDAHHVGPEQLRLFGVHYDTVDSFGNGMRPNDMKDPNETGKNHPIVVAGTRIITEPLETSYEDYTGQWCTFARTITAGKLKGEGFIQAMSEDSQNLFYKIFSQYMKRLFSLSRGGADQDPRHSPGSRLIEDTVNNTSQMRRVFLTQNGSFGLGPYCLRTGDIVAVLYGGVTPFILRPHGDRYLFMGQAYIDGIMNGQVMEEMQAGNLQEQEFCIV